MKVRMLSAPAHIMLCVYFSDKNSCYLSLITSKYGIVIKRLKDIFFENLKVYFFIIIPRDSGIKEDEVTWLC